VKYRGGKIKEILLERSETEVPKGSVHLTRKKEAFQRRAKAEVHTLPNGIFLEKRRLNSTVTLKTSTRLTASRWASSKCNEEGPKKLPLVTVSKSKRIVMSEGAKHWD